MVDSAVPVTSLRSVVAGAAVAIGIAALPAVAPVHGIKLTLDAPPPEHPHTIYFSVFTEGGDVTIATDVDGLVPLRFKTTANVTDGCRWLGTETLTPIDATHYAYSYEEEILSCVPGAPFIPTIKTPRNGIVTVEPYAGYSMRFMM
jgi:hypothetical protein